MIGWAGSTGGGTGCRGGRVFGASRGTGDLRGGLLPRRGADEVALPPGGT